MNMPNHEYYSLRIFSATLVSHCCKQHASGPNVNNKVLKIFTVLIWAEVPIEELMGGKCCCGKRKTLDSKQTKIKNLKICRRSQSKWPNLRSKMSDRRYDIGPNSKSIHRFVFTLMFTLKDEFRCISNLPVYDIRLLLVQRSVGIGNQKFAWNFWKKN